MIHPIVYVLEDDISCARAVVEPLAHKLLDVRHHVAAHSLRAALRPRQEYEKHGTHEVVDIPSLAIIDLDLSLSGRPPTPEDNSFMVLKELNRQFPSCAAIVWSGTVRDRLLEINLAHPRAIPVDKAFGLDHLLKVIDGILNHRAGDLELVGNAFCRHVPSGKIHRNSTSFELMCHHRIQQPLMTRPRDARKVKAIQRFREWLAINHSNMTVVARGQYRYELVEVASLPAQKD